MDAFSDLTVYLSEGTAEGPRPARPMVAGGMPLCVRLYTMLHEALGDEPGAFRYTLQRSGTAPLHLDWASVTPTAGIALWIRRGQVEAASIFLNGVEDQTDSQAIRYFFNSERLVVPDPVWDEIWESESRPLVTTLFYTAKGRRDPTIASTCTTLAVAYFGIFGTCEFASE